MGSAHVHILIHLWVHNRGCLFKVWADPNLGGLLDAPTRELTIFKVRKRNERLGLEKSSLGIFSPPGGELNY